MPCLPDQFTSKILCFDVDVLGRGVPTLLKTLVEIGQGTHGIAQVQLDNLGKDNTGQPINNKLRNKCVLIFKKLK